MSTILLKIIRLYFRVQIIRSLSNEELGYNCLTLFFGSIALEDAQYERYLHLEA
ncbi:MAG: hypothetical protein ACM65L_26185 [Microcoleus sp.]